MWYTLSGILIPDTTCRLSRRAINNQYTPRARAVISPSFPPEKHKAAEKALKKAQKQAKAAQKKLGGSDDDDDGEEEEEEEEGENAEPGDDEDAGEADAGTEEVTPV